jgi:integrase/recombinase XerD
MSQIFPCLVGIGRGAQSPPRLGHPLLDDYLELVAARLRRNSVLAIGFDLKVFFTVIDKDPLDVKRADVMAFIKAQRFGQPVGNVVRFPDGNTGLALSTIRRRLGSVSGFFSHLVALDRIAANPVQRGMAVRSPVTKDKRVVALVRPVRQMPRILEIDEVNRLLRALNTSRDRAICEAMVLAGLRRCETLGLRLEDIRWKDQRLFIADGKGGHQRFVPISPRFFATLRNYLDTERPANSTSEFVFVVLKGPNTGNVLTAKGFDEIIHAAKVRAGLNHATCHELRHTCFTRLRETGMALEAIQAQAGHRSISSTQIYLHLANDWLAGEYRRAAEAIDAQQNIGVPRPRSAS